MWTTVGRAFSAAGMRPSPLMSLSGSIGNRCMGRLSGHAAADRAEEGHLLTCSVNEDAGGTSVLLFNVLQVVLRLVHGAAGRENTNQTLSDVCREESCLSVCVCV